jgi:hypothetical protein
MNKINEYQNKCSYMVSDSDFTKFLGDDVHNKILKYSDLALYHRIDELLPGGPGGPGDIDYRIILTENKTNQGHWCCLLKYNNILEWFDSYSGKPDSELKYISPEMKAQLNEKTHYLTRLLKTKLPNQKIIYNKKKLQTLKDGINTCGRWTIARLIFFKRGYNLNDFLEYLDKIAVQTGKPYDIIVCDITS